MPNDADSAYLTDMLDAARAVCRFVSGRTIDFYLGDELLIAGVERKIEIIGEAARKVSAEFQRSCPEIPWSKIQGQRHVLAHDYGDIEQDRLWEVATVHVPALATLLERILAADSPKE